MIINTQVKHLTVPWMTSFMVGFCSLSFFTLISFTKGLMVIPCMLDIHSNTMYYMYM